MNPAEIRLARQLLSLNQTQFAAQLGWTSKRNVVSLEQGDKDATTQTALAIECMLRREDKFEEYEMLTEIQKRIDAQKIEIKNNPNLTFEDIKNIVFSEDDVVEAYLRDKQISEDDVDLESLRNLQHAMINELKT